MLTEKELIDRGFYKCELIPSIYNADIFYQKCYNDDKGKKYYLDAMHYSMTHPHTQEVMESWELSTQLYLKGSHSAFDLEFLGDDIDAAEQLIEFLFESGKLDYYEEL